MADPAKIMPERLDEIYELLKRDADMDGICTTSSIELAKEMGWHQSYIRDILDGLLLSGRIAVVGRTGGSRNIRELQLADY